MNEFKLQRVNNQMNTYITEHKSSLQIKLEQLIMIIIILIIILTIIITMIIIILISTINGTFITRIKRSMLSHYKIIYNTIHKKN